MWWEILKISKDSDKKAIKIAYAKLLKTTKPDENPEGFKRLYEAYQDALKFSNNTYYQDDYFNYNDTSNIETINDSSRIYYNKSDDNYLNILNTQESSEFNGDWRFLIDNTKDALNNPKSRNDLGFWTYLKNIPSMIDLEFKKRASDYIFDVISEINYDVTIQSKYSLKFSGKVLNYLDNIFNWTSQWKELNMNYEDKRVDSIVMPIWEFKKVDKATAGLRFGAFVLDVGLVLLLAFILNPISEYISIGIPMVYFGIIVPILEASKFEASIGKMLVGIKVVTNNNSKLTIYGSFGRSYAAIFCIIILAGLAFVLKRLAFLLIIFIVRFHLDEVIDEITNSYVIKKK